MCTMAELGARMRLSIKPAAKAATIAGTAVAGGRMCDSSMLRGAGGGREKKRRRREEKRRKDVGQ